MEMVHHVLLRKIYALGAFALLGFLIEQSHFRRLRGIAGAAGALTIYSYAIEIGQIFIDHTGETFAQHTFDVISGTIGGALGAFVALMLRAPHEPARRFEALGFVLALAALSWAFSETYAVMDFAKHASLVR